MTNNLIHTLWRADRMLAGALAMVMVAVGGIAGAALADHPHTDKIAVLPVAVSSQVTKTPDTKTMLAEVSAADPALAELVSEHRCLSEALYYEARGEGQRGQMAVAEVIFHRLRSAAYPKTICGVVNQGEELAKGCQFSFVSNGARDKPKNGKAWMKAQMLAARIMTRMDRLHDITADATHFHATTIRPDWAGHLEKTIQIGNHVFYRDLPRARQS